MSEIVVVHLYQSMLNEGREVFVDNWFMLLRLAEFLLQRNTYVTVKIYISRRVPRELTEVTLGAFRTRFITKGGIHIVRYKATTRIYTALLKPASIEHYNQNMGAVDAIDENIEPYGSTRTNY